MSVGEFIIIAILCKQQLRFTAREPPGAPLRSAQVVRRHHHQRRPPCEPRDKFATAATSRNA